MMKSRKSRIFATSGIKVVSFILITIAMLVTFTACGQQSKMTTEELSTEKEVGIWVNEPDQEIDPGVNITEATTEATTETTTESTTEVTIEATTEATTGQYSYDIDGHIINLHTNIDDYIVYSAQYSSYNVDLRGLAESLGFTPTGTDLEEWQQCTFRSPDGESKIALETLDNQNFYTIYLSSYGGETELSFSRWIGPEGEAGYKINYEQIILFTFLIENCVYDPHTRWIADVGFPRVSDTGGPYIISR